MESLILDIWNLGNTIFSDEDYFTWTDLLTSQTADTGLQKRSVRILEKQVYINSHCNLSIA